MGLKVVWGTAKEDLENELPKEYIPSLSVRISRIHNSFLEY